LKEKDQFEQGEWVLYEDGKLVHHSKNKIEMMKLIKKPCFFTCVGQERIQEINVISYVDFYDGGLKQLLDTEIQGFFFFPSFIFTLIFPKFECF